MSEIQRDKTVLETNEINYLLSYPPIRYTCFACVLNELLLNGFFQEAVFFSLPFSRAVRMSTSSDVITSSGYGAS